MLSVVCHSFDMEIKDVDETIKKRLCKPFGLVFEVVLTPPTTTIWTISFNHSCPLLTVNSGYREHIFDWIDMEQMSTELNLLSAMSKFVKNIYVLLGVTCDTLTLTIECSFFPFSCDILIEIDDDTVFSIGSDGTKTRNWINKTLITSNLNDININKVKMDSGGIYTRWNIICQRLISLDKPKDNTYKFTFAENKSVKCAMNSSTPLLYSISLHHPGSSIIHGNLLCMGEYTLVTLLYDIVKPIMHPDKLKCEIEAVTQWSVKLTSPDEISYTTDPTQRTTRYMKSSSSSVVENLLKNDSLSESEITEKIMDHREIMLTAVIITITVVIVALITLVCMFRRRLGLSVIDEIISRVQSRFEYSLANTLR